MPEKIESELLDGLTRQQNRLTLELTEWLIERFYCFSEDCQSCQAALLQRWVGLLVQSLIEGVRSEQPELLSDFVVVLRTHGKSFFEPNIWRTALGWLGMRCHRLLKNGLGCPLFPASTFLAEAELSDAELYSEQHETISELLDRLDRALRLGASELEPHQPMLPGLFQLQNLAEVRFSCNFNLN